MKRNRPKRRCQLKDRQRQFASKSCRDVTGVNLKTSRKLLFTKDYKFQKNWTSILELEDCGYSQLKRDC